MTTVAEMLVRLGPPPADICRDWARQLQQWEAPPPTSTAAGPTTADNADAQLLAAWSSVTVDSQGLLHPSGSLAATSTPGGGSIPALIAQLERWTELEASLEAASCNRPGNRLAAPTTAIAKEPAEKIAPATASSCSASLVVTTQPLTMEQGHRQVPSQRRLRRSRRSRRSYYLAASLVAAAGLVLLAVARWPAARPPALSANELSANELSANELSTGPAASAGLDATLSLLEPSLAEPSLAEPSLAEPSLAEPAEPISPAVADPADPLAVDVLSRDLALTTPVAESPPVNTTPTLLEADDGSQLLIPGESSIDILEELTSMANTATADMREHAVEADEEPNAAIGKPALTLNLSPPNQLHSFDKRLRPQQPVWQLRLVVSEGLKVVPSESQMVAGREGASWVVQEAPLQQGPAGNFAGSRSSSSAKTEVMVEVQLSHHRQSSLRWRIAAVPSDFPGVLIPLERDWLTGAQTALQTFTQQLLSQVEQTRLVGRTEGLPSTVRSELSARRRSLETQYKLAGRWLEIVADAHQLHGWLDGQIELHARLLDSALAPAPTILLFGDP